MSPSGRRIAAVTAFRKLPSPTRSSPSTHPKTETYERTHNEKPLDTDPGDALNPLGGPAAERDSRLPPSNHTRTCNKLPDVYM